MVQIYQQAAEPPSAASQFLTGVGQAIPSAVNQYFSKLANQREETAANQAAKRLGIDTTGLDPETRKLLLGQHLKGQQEQSLLQQKMSLEGQQKSKKEESEKIEDKKTYKTIKENYGEKAANLWQAMPTGAKTKLAENLFDISKRQGDVNQLFPGEEAFTGKEKQKEASTEKPIPQMKNGELPKDIEWPDFTKPPQGYSLKDWKDTRNQWRKENSDIFLKNKTSLYNDKRDAADFKRLDKLNKKLPKGIESLIINPESGEPYGAAQLAGVVSPEVQEWVKIISRFQNRAKDAFGSRVTNFDLVSYMKQYPGLLNSEEGRSRIIKMLQLNNEMDTAYENALDKVYKKYTLEGIPQEKADELATMLIQDETHRLYDEYLNLDNENQMSSLEKEAEDASRVQVMDADGNVVGTVNANEVGTLPAGYRIK